MKKILTVLISVIAIAAIMVGCSSGSSSDSDSKGNDNETTAAAAEAPAILTPQAFTFNGVELNVPHNMLTFTPEEVVFAYGGGYMATQNRLVLSQSTDAFNGSYFQIGIGDAEEADITAGFNAYTYYDLWQSNDGVQTEKLYDANGTLVLTLILDTDSEVATLELSNGVIYTLPTSTQAGTTYSNNQGGTFTDSQALYADMDAQIATLLPNFAATDLYLLN